MANKCMGLVLLVYLSLALFLHSHGAYASMRWNPSVGDGIDIVNPPPPALTCICVSLVVVHGYPCKEYEVITEDGYILSMQNIPQGRVQASGDGRRQPVLLQHGVLVDGMAWFFNSPDQSLGFVLADNGFDVWIANTRGTRWSLKHTSLASNTPDYWDWSWDELVDYDLQATVEFVYRQTGQKPNYIGHSLGTLVALASFSEGKLVDNLKSAALLCPIAYLSHMTTAIGNLAAQAFIGEIMNKWLHFPEFNPKGEPVAAFLNSLCKDPRTDCYDLLTAFTGKNCCLNSSTIDLFLKYEPQPTSTKTMVHLAQTVRDGVVSKFDYERSSVNIAHYGESKPPIYNMSNIPNNFPLFLSYGGQDALSDVQDVGLLLDSLKFHDGDKLTVQFVKDFAHADYVMGVTAKNTVYNAMIAFFNRL